MAEPLYRVTFPDPHTQQLVTLRVTDIADSSLGPMFVKLSGFVFEQAGRIINPNDAVMQARYEKTAAVHVNRMTMSQVEELEGAEEVQLAEAPNVVAFKPLG